VLQAVKSGCMQRGVRLAALVCALQQLLHNNSLCHKLAHPSYLYDALSFHDVNRATFLRAGSNIRSCRSRWAAACTRASRWRTAASWTATCWRASWSCRARARRSWRARRGATAPRLCSSSRTSSALCASSDRRPHHVRSSGSKQPACICASSSLCVEMPGNFIRTRGCR